MVGLEIYCGFTFFKDYMFGKSLACNGHIFSQLFFLGYFHAKPWKPTIHGVETSNSWHAKNIMSIWDMYQHYYSHDISHSCQDLSVLGCEKTCSDLRDFFFFKSPFALWSLDI